MERENGGTRLFRPDYDTPRPCAFHALWGRNVQGWWTAPAAQASVPLTERCHLEACDLLRDTACRSPISRTEPTPTS